MPAQQPSTRLFPKLACAVLLAAIVAGCGGASSGDGGPPPIGATASEASNTLGSTEPLVIHFAAAMVPSSLSLSGSLAAEASGTWSSTAAANDTYTLVPAGGKWRAGSGRTVVVRANGSAGGVATLSLAYAVNFAFDPNPAATAVVGQASFGAGTADAGMGAANAVGLDNPLGVAVAPDGRVFVSDYQHSRVLGYNALPTSPGTAADIVLGQPDFTTDAYVTTQASHPGAQGIAIGGGKMAVADRGANRVLIYNTVPTSSAALPDVVVGQPDFMQDLPACGGAALNQPMGVALTEDGKLLVADAGNNRVLVWNTVPTSNGRPADLVLGQSTSAACQSNDDNQDGTPDAVPTARTLAIPSTVWSDGRRVVVADAGNNRVLIWSAMPASSFQPANVVLGQSTFALNQLDDDDQNGTAEAAPTGRTLWEPSGIAVNGNQLMVADSGNHRVLVWNTFPTTNFAPADSVIGQASFTSGAAGAASATGLSQPSGLALYQDQLLVVDAGHHRVVGFRSR